MTKESDISNILKVCPNCGRDTLQGVTWGDIIKTNFSSLMATLNPISLVGVFAKVTKNDIIDPFRSNVVPNLGRLKCTYCLHYFVVCSNCWVSSDCITKVSFGTTMGSFGDTAKCPKCGKQVKATKL